MPVRLRAAALPWRYGLLSLLVSIIVAIAYLYLSDLQVVQAIEGETLDWRFQLRGDQVPPPQAVIIAIDDRTAAALGQLPVKRGALAAAVEKLSADHAAAIGIDMLILEYEQPSNGFQPSAGDQALIDALRNSGRGVLALAFTFAPGAVPGQSARRMAEAAHFRGFVRRPPGEPGAILRATDLRGPFSPLPDVAALGHASLPTGNGGTLRDFPAAIAFADSYVPALPIALAGRALDLASGDMELRLPAGLSLGELTLGQNRWLLDRRLLLPIDYYGPKDTIRTYSFIDLIQDRIPTAAIAGHVVLIGVTALGTGDVIVTPFGQAPGVEVLATITDNLLANQVPQHDALAWWDLAAILLLGFVAFALARLPLPLAAPAAAVILLALWSAGALIAFRHGLWLDMTFPAIAILLNAGGVALLRAGIERRMRQNLARYHSPAIVEMLAQSSTPGFGGSQEATVLFVDIAGFSTRIESMAPEATVRFLRDFHGRIERAMLAHGGVLEQFIGDGAMVVFGVPSPGPKDAAAALAAALDLLADIRKRNAELEAKGEQPFRVSVGIHCGPVVVARLGGPTQAQMSTSGDTVNVASRLEKLTRDHGAAIAISGAVVEAVKAAGGADLLQGFERVATQTVRGRAGQLSIWVKKEPGT
jgi:adenylate cyclase